MSKPVSPMPEGQRLFPYLSVRGADRAIAFYVEAFGASERYRLPMPDGRIGHAELAIDGVSFWLADEYPEMKIAGPESLGGTAVSLVLYVGDVDAFVARAAARGATVERDPEDEFYGDRTGVLLDPFGHRWMIHTRREEVSPEEMKQRMAGARHGDGSR
jgi:PhnB protein